MKKKVKQNFFIKIIFAVIMLFIKLKPSATGKVSDVYIINNKKSNIFIIKTNDGYIAIDAGCNAKNAQKELHRLKIDKSAIKYVLLTHTDYDHVATLRLFKSAKIYMGKDEFQLVDGSRKRQFFVRNYLPSNTKLEDINLLNDEEINLGECKIKCFKTPGHTVGSMTYLINDKYLFTGDALKIKNCNIKRHPFEMDKSKSTESIKKIIDIIDKSKFLFTAHYGHYKIEELNIAKN